MCLRFQFIFDCRNFNNYLQNRCDLYFFSLPLSSPLTISLAITTNPFITFRLALQLFFNLQHHPCVKNKLLASESKRSCNAKERSANSWYNVLRTFLSHTTNHLVVYLYQGSADVHVRKYPK